MEDCAVLLNPRALKLSCIKVSLQFNLCALIFYERGLRGIMEEKVIIFGKEL
jgi:hypothetical protein